MGHEEPAGNASEARLEGGEGAPLAGTEVPGPEVASPVVAAEVPSEPVWTYEHSWVIRITHWLNFLFLAILALSGLRIYWAYPDFLMGGMRIGWENPKFWRFSQEFYENWSLGGWLAGGLRWHYTFMWFYIANAFLYFGCLLFRGRYRHIFPTGRDLMNLWAQVRWYAGAKREEPPRAGIYNPLQKMAYMGINLLGIFSIVTGLAIYKPTQLGWLTQGLGGYQMARLWHFLLVPAFLLFFILHILMVILHGWPAMRTMVTGWRSHGHGLLLRLLRREGFRSERP